LWPWMVLYDLPPALALSKTTRVSRHSKTRGFGVSLNSRSKCRRRAEIETFIMLRRMALLAWIGSHIEAPEAQKLAPEFASVTAKIGKLYLEQCKMLTGN